MRLLLPHQLVEQKVRSDFDRDIRQRFFRGLEFAGPAGDPGWFGPRSAVWHVHSHTSALIFGLQCAAFIERLDPSIYWMGSDHSRVVERNEDGTPTGRFDLEGAQVRLGHSVAFFIGTAYGSTDTAEKLAQTVRAMHHTVKGTRPDGLAYDADDPDWLRWNYATVVWGIATAHEMYHPTPVSDIDRYYGEFVRVGHALGGTDLPATKADTLDCLKSYLPRLALTHGAAMTTGAPLMENPDAPAAAKFFDWAIRDSMPDWAAEMVAHRPPHPVERAARRAATWTAINATQAAMGPLREFRQAQRRVSGGTAVTHTEPAYVAGSDPVRSREAVERAL
ncbi:MAG: DUF2236 domain-containing protein [Mycobacteriaceae bacterium]|nr:DUF2236 domain-containing protein [Mycobacteriaceae bacterium]